MQDSLGDVKYFVLKNVERFPFCLRETEIPYAKILYALKKEMEKRKLKGWEGRKNFFPLEKSVTQGESPGRWLRLPWEYDPLLLPYKSEM